MSTITSLQTTDNGANSRGVINTNFTNLNTDKLETSGGTLSGQLNFSGTTHAGVKLLSLTTSQRDALSPANGMIIYNTTTEQVEFYQNGAWTATTGSPDMDTTTKGVGEQATTAEIDAGTDVGSTAAHLVVTPDQLKASTYYTSLPSTDQKAALAGTSGTPSVTNKYVTNDDVASTATGLKIPRGNSNNKIDSGWINSSMFGGTGEDGDLILTSGATNIDLGGLAVVIKQYKNLSITGTASITFTNPNASGSIVIFKVKENATLTSVAPIINLKGMGAAGGQTQGVAGTISANTFDSLATYAGQGGGEDGSRAGGLILNYKNYYSYDSTTLFRKSINIISGQGGGAGYGVNFGKGGNGGGAFYMEVGGIFEYTTALGIDVSGNNGSNSTAAGSGGGGGGSAGMAVILYNTAGTITGTINSAGGAGGSCLFAGASVGGGGGGSLYSAGGAGGSNGAGAAASSLAAGGGGSGGNNSSGGAGGASQGGIISQNYYF